MVKVTGNDYTVSDLVTINNANEGGEINLNDRSVGLSGTAANVKAALAGTFTTNQTHTGVVTISDNGTTVKRLILQLLKQLRDQEISISLMEWH